MPHAHAHAHSPCPMPRAGVAGMMVISMRTLAIWGINGPKRVAESWHGLRRSVEDGLCQGALCRLRGSWRRWFLRPGGQSDRCSSHRIRGLDGRKTGGHARQSAMSHGGKRRKTEWNCGRAFVRAVLRTWYTPERARAFCLDSEGHHHHRPPNLLPNGAVSHPSPPPCWRPSINHPRWLMVDG